jgi:hypothetical protein
MEFIDEEQLAKDCLQSTFDQIKLMYDNKLKSIKDDYESKLITIKNQYNLEIKRIEHDASTFKHFGIVRQLDKEKSDISNLLEISQRQNGNYKLQIEELNAKISKLIDCVQDATHATVPVDLHENDDTGNECENIQVKIETNTKPETKIIAPSKTITIGGNLYYISDVVDENDRFQFYNEVGHNIGYKTQSGKTIKYKIPRTNK